MRLCKSLLVAILSIGLSFAAQSTPLLTHSPFPIGPEDIPDMFTEAVNLFDFTKREEMITMRDGVKLFTVILIPRGKERMPILFTRTPYGAFQRASRDESPRLEAVLPPGDDVIATAGYIRVFQDVRGKHRSEGDYRMNRPLRGPLNQTSVDHSTDTYDTIEWLLKNVRETNGRVGMIGTSYDGFLVLMGMVNPHPALRAAVPVNPMVDGWMGDDWFHKGAFRQIMMDYIYDQEASRDSSINWWNDAYDQYEQFLRAGSAGEFGRRMGMEQLGFWRQLIEHPDYDSFWQLQAVDKILAAQPLKVPTLYVHGLWDQEDIYGDIATYLGTEPKDKQNDANFLAIGPWCHSGVNRDGSSLGPIRFNGDTAFHFRRNVLLPFLDEHLKDNGPKANIPSVLAYQSGSNSWLNLNTWPPSCESGCPGKMQPIYLQPGLKLGFEKPAAEGENYNEYVSDPAKPVPYRHRPIRPTYSKDSTWNRWLVDDQRGFSDRPDVLTYVSDALSKPLELGGQPVANLFASISGTDSDFVVKLIDVYPDEYPSQPELGGYQLMVSADILRGRYRSDFAKPSPISPGKAERYRWSLPTVSHVFLPGHRVMVQIQSSWFPLYDRNPQKFVENIFWAKPEDYRKSTQRIYFGGAQASSIELPAMP